LIFSIFSFAITPLLHWLTFPFHYFLSYFRLAISFFHFLSFDFFSSFRRLFSPLRHFFRFHLRHMLDYYWLFIH
jgi:hypothetical protein